MKNFHVNEDCISCGLCENICPEVFRMGDEDKAECYKQPTEDLIEKAEEAMNSCPVYAILRD